MCLKEVCDNSLVGRRIRVLMLTYLSLVMLSCLVVSYPLNFGKKEKRKKKRKREREREREERISPRLLLLDCNDYIAHLLIVLGRLVS